MNLTALNEFLNHPLVKIQGLDLSVALLLRVAALFVIVLFMSRAIRTITYKALARFPHVDNSTANSVSTLVYYMILALGVTWALGTLGLDSTSLAVFTGALGLGVGLGFQDMAKNFISGIIMLISKTIKPGDIISLDDLTGRVEMVGMYSSQMKTVHDATVIIPNSEILNNKFINWTHDRSIRMLEIPIGVHYDSDLDVVQKILHDAAAVVDHILSEPGPRVLLDTYGDSSVNFTVRVWTDEVMYYRRVISAYNLEVWRRFKDQKVSIPYPQQDVYIKEMPRV
ncbi:MAG: mechanosensitive ion channel [Armatimonadetes bacterium]|nr:mechanosensitive ion channel [Armatimonadota bacterium]MBS1701599.1 mechanosensitive ion channel [Armatimonadota bacterium]MBS1725656.1 mechanosensitive ion channel [Armatimonadota bacterium]